VGRQKCEKAYARWENSGGNDGREKGGTQKKNLSRVNSISGDYVNPEKRVKRASMGNEGMRFAGVAHYPRKGGET